MSSCPKINQPTRRMPHTKVLQILADFAVLQVRGRCSELPFSPWPRMSKANISMTHQLFLELATIENPGLVGKETWAECQWPYSLSVSSGGKLQHGDQAGEKSGEGAHHWMSCRLLTSMTTGSTFQSQNLKSPCSCDSIGMGVRASREVSVGLCCLRLQLTFLVF